MPETMRCPDCGHENPPGSESCAACNFPLAGLPPPSGVPAAGAALGDAQGEPATARGPLRPFRPSRPPPASNQALTLWLVFGTLCALIVLFIGLKANVERASVPVPGSSETDQRRADELRAALEKDSTDVEARIGLADILYNTANWPEAIVHYRSALRRDSTRTSALVDLGVCYYNLGDSNQAEQLFQLALQRDPHHPIALFNLGIVYEQREKYDLALQYFHRALESSPPEDLSQPIAQAMERVMKKLGKTAPPLSGVR